MTRGVAAHLGRYGASLQFTHAAHLQPLRQLPLLLWRSSCSPVAVVPGRRRQGRVASGTWRIAWACLRAVRRLPW